MKSHEKTFQMPGRLSRAIVRGLLPGLCVTLAKEGSLQREHLESRESVFKVLRVNYKAGIKKMRLCWAIEVEFIEQATRFWKKGKKFIAVVLFVAAVEQYLNQALRWMMEFQGLTTEEATTVIKGLNMDARLYGMFPLLSGQRFGRPLARRLKKLFEIRNAIVHFKGVDGLLDSRKDSLSMIDAELSKMKRLSLSRDYYLFSEKVWGAVLKKMPHMDVGIRASEILLDPEFLKARRKAIMPNRK